MGVHEWLTVLLEWHTSGDIDCKTQLMPPKDPTRSISDSVNVVNDQPCDG